MAGLISWLGNEAKKIKHDVVQAPATVQHTVSKAVAQINPLDNGRTFQNNAPVQAHQGSLFHQATHNGLTNATGNFVVKPLVRSSEALNQGIGNAELKLAGRPTQNAQQAFGNINKFSGYTGTKSQIAGDAITNIANIATPGSSKVVKGAFEHVLPSIVPKIVSHAVANSGVAGVGGGINNVGTQLAAGNIHTVKDVPHVFEQGAAPAAALGGLGTIAAPVLRIGATKALSAVERSAPKVQSAAKQATSLTPRTTLNDQHTLIDLSNHYGGSKPLTGSALSNTLAKSQEIAKRHGADITSGSQLDRMQSVNSVLDDLQNKGRLQAQTGAVGKNVSNAAIPAPEQPKGFILKEGPIVGGKRDVIRAVHNPETGHLEPRQESISASNPNGPSVPPDFLQATPSKPRVGLPERDPNLERAIQNTLRTATPDEAILQHMDTTGSNLQTAAREVSRIAKESDINLGSDDIAKNPVLGKVGVPTVAEGDFAQATNNAKFVHNSEQTVGRKAVNSYKALSSHDQVLLKEIETTPVAEVAKSAEKPEAFKQAEQDIRTYYNTRHAYDHALGIDVGYRSNYLRQVFAHAEQPTEDNQISLKGSGKHPGYTIERSKETLGADVGNALQKDIQGASFNHAKLAYEKGLNEAYPNKIARGELVRDKENGVYRQLENKYGQDLSAPKNIAHDINSRAWGDNASKALNRYDTINHGLKYAKLSGGFFHAFTEAGNFTGQQLASGKLITDPVATGKLFKVFMSPKTMDREITKFNTNGTLDNAHLAGLTTRPSEILADVNVKTLDKGKNAIAKYTGIQAIHDATFQREIPYAKLKIFEQKTQGLDVNKPADLAKMRQVARETNQIFGGINREIQGIKPSTFKWIQRVLLATDFTEGKWHTLIDAVHAGGPAGTLARQAVIGKAILFGVLASAGAAAGGEFKGKSPKQIAKNAAGNLLDPAFEMGGYTAKLPKTFISEAVGALKPTQQNVGAPWNGSGLLSYGTARAAALPSEVIQLLSNKDYYGQPLYGKNTKKNGGAQIKPQQAALNLTNTVAPIPFGQGVKTAAGKQNIAAGAANVAGLNVRPNPANTVTLQGVSTTLTDPQRRQYQDHLTQTQKKLLPQLLNSSTYKSMSPNDQANAVSQLKQNITAQANRDIASKDSLGQYAPNFTGKDTQATAKEQQVSSGKIDPTTYVKGAKSSGISINPKIDTHSQKVLTEYNTLTADQKTSKSTKEPSYDYKVLSAKFANNVANNKLDAAGKIKGQAAVDKAQVGAKYSKDVRDLYGLSKAQLNDYLTTNDNGKALYDQLQAYDNDLVAGGQITTRKFKYGLESAATAKGSGGSGSAKNNAYLENLKYAAAIKPPKAPKVTLPGKLRAPGKTALRKYTPKKIAISKAKKVSVRRGVV